MTEGNFVDYIKIHAASGKGGKGSVHLHREKYIAKGGPDGGDGGRGGHVILRADKNLWTLFHMKFKKHFKAEHGGDGSSGRSTGKDGKDVYIDVPLGTIVRDPETEEIILKNLERITKNKTTIIISHRISSIKHADSILVLEDGNILQKGTHEQLSSVEGFYKELYEQQLLEDAS